MSSIAMLEFFSRRTRKPRSRHLQEISNAARDIRLARNRGDLSFEETVKRLATLRRGRFPASGPGSRQEA